MKQVFVMAHPTARSRAVEAVRMAPEGFVVRIAPPNRSLEQNDRYHAMLDDIAKQWTFMGRKWPADDVKRILVDAFAEAMRQAGTPLHHDGRIVPSLDGLRVVQLGIQTSRFRKAEASEFIEFLFAWGAEKGIVWSNEHRKAEACTTAD